MRSAIVFLFTVLFFATGCSYRPGSLLRTPDSPTRAARQRGCVDIAVTLADDARVDKPSALLVYSFGNRCSHPELLDLRRVVVTGETPEGERIALAPHDPSGNLHVDLLEADADGKEIVRYDVRKDRDGEAREGLAFAKICVDLRRVVEEPAERSELCLAPPGDTYALVTEQVQYRALEPSASGSAWSVVPFPRLRFDMGISGYSTRIAETRMSRSGLGTFDGARVFGAERVGGVTWDLRLTGFVADRVYVGGEISLGGGGAPGGVVVAGGSAIRTEGANFRIATGAIVGVVLDRVGPMQPRLEIVGGARVVLAHAATGDCNGSPCRNLFGFQPTVMPRAGADFFLGPFFTIGPWVGVDLASQGDFAAGVTFAVHGRSYDGRW
ncbi:MAG: hypothetical protein JST00_46215 [Deltaproteobacteria bacterium]|nr:hypothetical protein [Deltaproteobacteria bacterium]